MTNQESSIRPTHHPNGLLVLFDIDGTLLLSRRAGAIAMIAAARRFCGAEILTDGLEFAGRLDSEIWISIARQNGIPDPTQREREFRAAYAAILEEILSSRPMAYPLPGVEPLLAALRKEAGMTVGLLTGNFPETGRLKIRAAGLDPAHFLVSVWGDDGKTRRELPTVAMRRFCELNGHPIAPERVIIVGDTPHDIDCAHANGCLALAVATGPSFRLPDLQAFGPELAVEDLSRTEQILAWLRERGASSPPASLQTL